MRMMSFAMSVGAFLDGTKTVTRRVATSWMTLKPGTRLQAVERAQGLKRGEQVRRLGVIEVVDVRREPLAAIRDEPHATMLEGFPLLDPETFIAMFCDAQGCDAATDVVRIEFRRVRDGERAARVEGRQ